MKAHLSLFLLAGAIFLTAGKTHPPELGPHFTTPAVSSSVARVIKTPVFFIKDVALAKHRFTQSAGSAAVRLGVDLVRIALYRVVPSAVRAAEAPRRTGSRSENSRFGWDRF